MNSTTHILVRSSDTERVQAFLPRNYQIIGLVSDLEGTPTGLLVAGSDSAGWTAEGYVIPRLYSGLIAAEVL